MATSTPNFSFTLPAVNNPVDEDLWGTQLNANWSSLDSLIATRTLNYNFADFELQRPEIKDYSESLDSPGSITGATTIDFENGNHYEATMTGNVTFTINNPPASGNVGILVLYLKQDPTGSRLVTWPASVEWPGGSEPTLTTTADRTDIITLITRDGGTTYTGSTVGLDYDV